MPSWYDPSKLKSYNKTLNFVLGGRGIGKTYGMKKDAVSHYLKTGKQFFYIRRNTADMKHALTFMDDIINNEAFEGHEITTKGGKMFVYFYIDGEIMGYALPLSRAITLKSSSYPKVDCIIYDEFIPDRGGYNSYIPGEVELFLNLCDSILRQRQGHIYLLANSQSKVNPYFTYFDVSPKEGKEFTIFKGTDSKKEIVIEVCQDAYTKGTEEKTGFHKLIEGTRYGAYNEGEFAYNDDDFIARRTPTASYSCTLYIDGLYYGVYIDHDEGVLYVSTSCDKDYPYRYAIGKDRKENMLLAKTWRKEPRLNLLVRSFRDGSLYYENETIKQLATDYLIRF